nr:DUF4267 domain-containing protein [Actinomadura sp. J1-007]
MLSPVAYGLAVVLALFVAFIGARFLLVPKAAAAGYGVPAKRDGDAAYLEVKGLRDLTFGLLGLALLAFADAGAAGWYMLVVAVAPSATPSSCCGTAGRRPRRSASTSRPRWSSSSAPPCCSPSEPRPNEPPPNEPYAMLPSSAMPPGAPEPEGPGAPRRPG